MEQLQTEISLLEASINEQENIYKGLQREIEKNDQVLQNLSEEILASAEDERTKPTQIELVKEKISLQQKKNRELKEELKKINDQKVPFLSFRTQLSTHAFRRFPKKNKLTF